MKITVITPPYWIKDELLLYGILLDRGIDFIRIRKPTHTASEMNSFLKSIPQSWYPKVIVHQPKLDISSYPSIGVHRTDTHPEIKESCGIRSTTMHHLEELPHTSEYDQVLVSPIFDSISKEGYKSKWKRDMLSFTNEKKETDWIALGGISPTRLDQVSGMGFNHAAIMGYLWQDAIHNGNIHYDLLNSRLDTLNQSKNEI
ncbi:thiamine phosphate synthase [Prolixibacteraceae bacterium]|nr:thiamine phosphate synthase [Prolixibacteraceae bacterium]